jgi:hypothetical protein
MANTSKNNNNIEEKVGAIDSISKKALTFDVHHLLFQSMKIIDTSRKASSIAPHFHLNKMTFSVLVPHH